MNPWNEAKTGQSIPSIEITQQECHDLDHAIAQKEDMIRPDPQRKPIRSTRGWSSDPFVISREGKLSKMAQSHRGQFIDIHCPHCGFSSTVCSDPPKAHHERTKNRRRRSSQTFAIDPEELSQLLEEIPTVQIARLYRVSPKEIEKCCRAWGIPQPSRGDQSIEKDEP